MTKLFKTVDIERKHIANGLKSIRESVSADLAMRIEIIEFEPSWQ